MATRNSCRSFVDQTSFGCRASFEEVSKTYKKELHDSEGGGEGAADAPPTPTPIESSANNP